MIDCNSAHKNNDARDNNPNRNRKDECGSLAMAYVRIQEWEEPRSAMDALKNGTAFRSLTMPFWAMEVRK